MTDQNNLSHIQKIIDAENIADHNRLIKFDKKCNDSCLALTEKIKYFIANPQLTGNIIADSHYDLIDHLNRSQYDPRRLSLTSDSYYTGCDEFKDLIKKTNETNPDFMIIIANGKSFVSRTDISVQKYYKWMFDKESKPKSEKYINIRLWHPK